MSTHDWSRKKLIAHGWTLHKKLTKLLLNMWLFMGSSEQCGIMHLCTFLFPSPSSCAFHAVKLNRICLNFSTCNPPSFLYYSTCLLLTAEKIKFKERKDSFILLPCSKRKRIFVTDIFDTISIFWPHKQLLLKISMYFCTHFCFPIMHYILKTLKFS